MCSLFLYLGLGHEVDNVHWTYIVEVNILPECLLVQGVSEVGKTPYSCGDEETMLSGFTRLQEITGDNLCLFTYGLSDPDSD